MFRLRRMTEAYPRWKKGQPPHSTTGVARAKASQLPSAPDRPCPRADPVSISPMVSTRRGRVSAVLAQNRWLMSTNSGSASSSRVTVRGSRDMPQMGHAPGLDWTTSGCMGQI